MPLDDVIFRSSISCDTCLSAAVVVLGHYTIDTLFMLMKFHVFALSKLSAYCCFIVMYSLRKEI